MLLLITSTESQHLFHTEYTTITYRTQQYKFMHIHVGSAFYNKKFELMLTRCAKDYSSSCSQTVSLSPAISSQFIHGVCAIAKITKINFKNPYFGNSGSFKVIDVETTEKLITSACCDR